MVFTRLWGFIRLTRPFFLLGGVLLYLLGVMIAFFEGTTFNPGHYLAGQFLVTATQLMVQYGNEYYDREVDAAAGKARTWLSGGSGALALGLFEASFVLRASLVCGVASLIGLAVVASQSLMAGILGLVVILVSWSYSTPPLRLMGRGLGELSASLIVALLTPLFGWLLQSGAGAAPLRLLILCLPLVLIHTGMLIAFEFPDRFADSAYGKRTLVVRLGVRQSAWLHDGLIGLAFILYAIYAILGSSGIVHPFEMMGVAGRFIFIALPLATWQIIRIHWQLRHPKAGYQLLVTGAMGLFGLSAALWVLGLVVSKAAM